MKGVVVGLVEGEVMGVVVGEVAEAVAGAVVRVIVRLVEVEATEVSVICIFRQPVHKITKDLPPLATYTTFLL